MQEFFDHTADLGLRIRAKNPELLFAEAAEALFSAIVENPEAIRPRDPRELAIAGEALDDLLFDFLRELLFQAETEHRLFTGFVVTLHPGGLHATFAGEPFDPSRHLSSHEVKAVTYHDLKVEQQGDEWLAEVIVDI